MLETPLRGLSEAPFGIAERAAGGVVFDAQRNAAVTLVAAAN